MPDAPGLAITGLGLVLPQGAGLAAAEAVFAGPGGQAVPQSAVRFLGDMADLPGATGAPVAGFTPPAGTRGLDRAVQFAVAAADEAWRGAALDRAPAALERVATILSLSKGAVFALAEAASHTGRARGGAGCAGDRRPGAAGLLDATADVAARTVAARRGLTGPLGAPVTACASGGHAMVWGARLIRRGVVDAALVGAAEASLHPLILGSYCRMGVLADPRGDPATSVRPFSVTRRGFAVGEGAGVMVLESADSAARRGVRPLAWLRGWATGCQASSLTDAEPGGETLAALVGLALDRAGVRPEAVDFIHAHGTATAANDVAEARAIRAALGAAARGVSVSSTKGSHGHLLGAATAAELVLTILAMARGQVPPTLNLTDPDPAIGLDCTPLVARRREIRCALKLAGGFGGQMLAAVLARA